MKLDLSYDPETDALALGSGHRRRTSVLLESEGHIVIDLPDEESRVVVGLEIFGISAYLPWAGGATAKQQTCLPSAMMLNPQP